MPGRTSSRLAIILIVSLIALLALSACARNAAEAPMNGNSDGASPQAPTEPPAQQDPSEGEFTALEAVNLALELYPEGAVVELELEHEEDRDIWEVLIRQPDGSGIELELDAQTGDVLSQKPARVPAEAAPAAPRTPAEAAIAVALEAVPGTVVEVELEMEGGGVVWEVSIDTAGGRMDVYVDVNSGEVIGTEVAS